MVLLSFRNLAFALEEKGDQEGGKALRLRALDEQEKAVGQKDTAFLSNLRETITLYNDKKDFATALPLAQRRLKIREATLPEGAPETLDAMESVANLQDDLDNIGEAVRLTRLIIELRESKQPEQKSYLTDNYNNLSYFLGRLGQKAEELTQMRKCVEIAQAALPADDSKRVKYEKRLAKLESEASPEPEPKEDKAPPSLEDYAVFRKDIYDRIEAGKWKRTKLALPAEAGRTRIIFGDWNGDKMERAFESNTIDDTSGTFTFYYLNPHGALMSIYRVREGADVPVDDVKKATDAFNFFDRKLVSWKRTQDATEKVEEPGSEGFDEKGKETYDAAQKLVLEILKVSPDPK